LTHASPAKTLAVADQPIREGAEVFAGAACGPAGVLPRGPPRRSSAGRGRLPRVSPLRHPGPRLRPRPMRSLWRRTPGRLLMRVARRLPFVQHPPLGRGRRPPERRGPAAARRVTVGALAAEAAAPLPPPGSRSRRGRASHPPARHPHAPPEAISDRTRRSPARRRVVAPLSKARRSIPFSFPPGRPRRALLARFRLLGLLPRGGRARRPGHPAAAADPAQQRALPFPPPQTAVQRNRVLYSVTSGDRNAARGRRSLRHQHRAPPRGERRVGIAILIKVNQIGTLTETIEAIDTAKKAG